MSELQTLRQALYPELAEPAQRAPSRRQKRAVRTRARALSPLRIVMLLASIPVLTATTALGVFIRTSPYEPELALRHLAALAGCEVAHRVGLAPSHVGGPGYHARNDADLDGIACDALPDLAAMIPARDAPPRQQPGTAKFVRP
ncbi:excalibur calcium-binding domain-containing protein [Ruegeria aquimaris]|uniref:Excalibur calcium-binding domain-containing protein n=1 Tax=Ruegeria aquimaris TaxID=2984333 RepID=A0ABT3AGX8_9RHOB|nr:excalibur calcium-binding domain-containing protein [Ruegeria sp. XHP0148]MCV2887918.1 excalibur calcium-binding domain-containing protein [Ruegeria sp. XHP0148]